jgi:hypothetical protein
MSEKDKAGLFKEGARNAVEFLEGFDWKGYKILREKLSAG